MSSTTSTPVKRACDSCHRRKVKCIGEGTTSSCKNCVSAGLACTYNAIPQKKGPKGSRAKVLSELRENQRHAQLAGLPHELHLDGRTLATFARTPGLLPPGLVDSCIDYFFANVYPSQPILHRQRAQETAMAIEHSAEAYCLILSLCAYVLIQANMTVPPNLFTRPEMAQLSHVSIGQVLLEEAVRVRRSYDYLENPTHASILTAWFFYGSYFGLGRDNTAWSYLREATTQAQLLGLHDEDAYKADPIDVSRKRVLYWLLLVAERTQALHKHRPITLFPTIHAPSLSETPSDRPIASGFDLLINLFKPIDDTFVQLWNKARSTTNPSWMARLQNQLSEALPAYLDCTESQAVDLRVTQQWLRTMVWQLCVSQGLVSTVAADNAMTFRYPIEISRDLLSLTQQFSQHAMEVLGVGLIEKLFDIACCLTDVVACIPFSPDAFALGPRDYVSRFLTLFSALRGGQTRYLQLLLAKVTEVLPDLPLPRSLNLPPNMSPSSMGIGSSSISVHSNMSDDLAGFPPVTSPPYPSTDLIRQLAAQTGAQLPFSSAQQSLLHAPSSRVEDLTLYDTTAPHSTRSGSAPESSTGTPGPFDSASQSRAHQGHSHSAPHIPSTLSQHGHMPSHHLGAAYDPRFAVQAFPVDPSMVYKADTDHAAPLQSQGSMFSDSSHLRRGGGLGHGRGPGGYAG